MSVIANLYCNLPAWANQSYSVRNCVSSGGNAYRCTTAGTAPTAPSGTSTTPVSFGTGLGVGTSQWVWLSAITFSGATADAVFAAAEAGSTASGGLTGSITQPIIWECWWTNDATWQTSAAGTPFLTLSGHAFTPTNNFVLRFAPGESIRDAGSGTPGALNAAKGGSFTLPSSTGNQNYFNIFDSNVTFEGLQIKDPNATSGSTILKLNAGANNFHFRGGIIDGASQTGGAIMFDHGSGGPSNITGTLFTNSLIIDRQATNLNSPTLKDGLSSASSATFVNCTFVAVNPQNATPAIVSNGLSANSWTVRNCISIGYANGILALVNSGGVGVIDHCGTDASQIANAGNVGTDGGGELVSQTVANMFVSSTADFRLKSGSPFLNNGVTDATDIPAQEDLFRTSRPQGTAWDMGAFEFPLSLSLTPAAGSIVFTGQTPTVSGPSGSPAGAAWNPSDKDAGITLSAGNTIATTTVASQTGVRSVTSNSAGKFYAEFTAKSVPGNGLECGIATGSWSFNTPLGANANSLGVGIFGGDVHLNGALLGNIGGGATIGSVISIAWNITNDLIWIRLNNGPWNANGTANPDTGIGGWTTSALADGPYFGAMGDLNTSGASLLFNGSAPFTETPPSTFPPWNGVITGGIFPSAGSIAVTGYAPTLNQSLLPGVGSIVFAGQTPSLVGALLPDVGAITFAGFSPDVSGGNIAIAPDTGSIAFSGFNPDVSGGSQSLTPDAGSLTFTGFAPSADQAPAFIFAPDSGSITLTGAPPTVTGQSIWTEIDAAREGIWTLYATGPSAPTWQTQV